MERKLYHLTQYLALPPVPPLPLDHRELQYLLAIIHRNLKDYEYLPEAPAQLLSLLYLSSEPFV